MTVAVMLLPVSMVLRFLLSSTFWFPMDAWSEGFDYDEL